MRCVNDTFPPRARARWLLMTMRLSMRSLAGIARTLGRRRDLEAALHVRDDPDAGPLSRTTSASRATLGWVVGSAASRGSGRGAEGAPLTGACGALFAAGAAGRRARGAAGRVAGAVGAWPLRAAGGCAGCCGAGRSGAVRCGCGTAAATGLAAAVPPGQRAGRGWRARRSRRRRDAASSSGRRDRRRAGSRRRTPTTRDRPSSCPPGTAGTARRRAIRWGPNSVTGCSGLDCDTAVSLLPSGGGMSVSTLTRVTPHPARRTV
jgi:hypothetical protein